MADAADSKSVVGDYVRVQVPPPALKNVLVRTFFFYVDNSIDDKN